MNEQDLGNQVELALKTLLPAMTVDGGGAEVILLREDILRLRLTGSCEFCPSRKMSAAALVRGLRELVPHLSEVIVE